MLSFLVCFAFPQILSFFGFPINLGKLDMEQVARWRGKILSRQRAQTSLFGWIKFKKSSSFGQSFSKTCDDGVEKEKANVDWLCIGCEKCLGSKCQMSFGGEVVFIYQCVEFKILKVHLCLLSTDIPWWHHLGKVSPFRRICHLTTNAFVRSIHNQFLLLTRNCGFA